MNNISIGNLNDRIIFYKEVDEKDDWGEVTKTKEEVFSCWALVRSQFYKEFLSSMGTSLQNSTTFIIRHQQKAEVTTDMIISYKNKEYNIIEINPDFLDKKFDTIIAKVVP